MSLYSCLCTVVPGLSLVHARRILHVPVRSACRLQEEAESARQATEPTAAQSTQGAQSSADVSQQALEQTASAIDASDLQAQLDQAKKDLEAEKARTKDACNQVRVVTAHQPPAHPLSHTYTRAYRYAWSLLFSLPCIHVGKS